VTFSTVSRWPGRPAGDRAGRDRGGDRTGGCAPSDGCQPGPEDHRARTPRCDGPIPRSRWTAGSGPAPGPGSLDDVPRRSGSSFGRYGRSHPARRRSAPGELRWRRSGARRHRDRSRWSSARCAGGQEGDAGRRLGPRVRDRAERAAWDDVPAGRARSTLDTPARARAPGGARRPAAAERQVDPARRAAYEALAAVHRDDAFGNIVLPRTPAGEPVVGRDAALRHRARLRRAAERGPAGRDHRRGAGRPWRGSTRPAGKRCGWVPTSCCTPGFRRTPRWRPRWTSSARWPRGGSASPTRCCGGCPKRPRCWLARVAPSAASDPVGHLALVHAHPQWIVRAFAESLGAEPAQPTGFAE
jgi:16S rRNA (cytosine967-C5)-methyltransferase